MRRRAALSFLIFIFLLAASAGADSTVSPGWDLFESQSGTTFTGLGDLKGVPLMNFNFGGVIGNQQVGPTDTIIQRTGTAIATMDNQTVSVAIQFVALQLETAAPVNFMGNGADNYFVTLTPNQQDTGTLGITFNSASIPAAGGTFTSSITLNADIHKGALNGAAVDSVSLMLSSGVTPWSRTPPPGSVTIPGVNQLLDGADTNQDFWPGMALPQMVWNGGGLNDVAEDAVLPLPSSVNGGIALLLVLVVWRLRSQANCRVRLNSSPTAR
jgi:hypothetical protein